jgi:hypothetical protein
MACARISTRPDRSAGHWYKAASDRVAQYGIESTLLYGQLVKRRERKKVVFTMHAWWPLHALICLVSSNGFFKVSELLFRQRLLNGSI